MLAYFLFTGGVLQGGILPANYDNKGVLDYDHESKHIYEPEANALPDVHPKQDEIFHQPIYVRIPGIEKTQGSACAELEVDSFSFSLSS